MSPRSRGVKRVADAFATPSPFHHICSSCLQTLSRRSYASAATAKASLDSASPPPITQLSPSGPEASLAPQPIYTIKAGIVLSRPPLLTPDPHPFETAYYLYQRRLNERLVLPFTQYFYYRRNTPAFEYWRKHRRERGGAAARDIGKYNAYTKESWNDEVLVGDETGRPERIVEKLIAEEGRQGEFTGKGDPRFAGLRRTTGADEANDQRSLERRLQRTLYLLVKMKGLKGQKLDEESEKWSWKFPSGPVVGFEGLKEVRKELPARAAIAFRLLQNLILGYEVANKWFAFQAAQRVLFTSVGPNMNTFFVGNHPVGHYIAKISSPQPSSTSSPSMYTPGRSPPESSLSSSEATSATTDLAKTTDSMALKQDLAATQSLINGEKTFFMKARIMAGQADLSPSHPRASEASETESQNTQNLPAGVEKGSPRDQKGTVVDMGGEDIEDFRWLSKEEVQELVHPEYWKGVRNMLVAQ